MTANEWVELLIAQGPRLRDAGVTSLQFDGMAASFTLAPPRLDGNLDEKNKPIDDPGADPLQNPALYFGGVVPGYEFNPSSEDDQ